MIQDLHSHTYFSACGVEVLGITDHNYGIGDRKREYFDILTE